MARRTLSACGSSSGLLFIRISFRARGAPGASGETSGVLRGGKGKGPAGTAAPLPDREWGMAQVSPKGAARQHVYSSTGSWSAAAGYFSPSRRLLLTSRSLRAVVVQVKPELLRVASGLVPVLLRPRRHGAQQEVEEGLQPAAALPAISRVHHGGERVGPAQRPAGQ